MPNRRIHTFHVLPKLPKKLQRLTEIIYDLHWTWSHEAIDLFRRLDQQVWRSVGQNPVQLLARLPQQVLIEAAEDEGFLSHLERVWLDFEVYRNERTWYQSTFGDQKGLKIAYLSAEFGLHECVPIYSGGLGILAGDHLKAASDLGVPIVAVGLMYQKGYFRQYLNADGWQQETYPETDVFHTPIKLMRDKDEKPLEFTVRVGPRDVRVHIWQAQVGRVDLYLLDTNVLENVPEDRRITENLYGGDAETRVRQEIVLGIGGIMALGLLGIKATIFHMNEGHSAFLALERARLLMNEYNLSFAEASEAARASHVFTTHTPVPAGIDRFSHDLVEKYFHDYWPMLGLNKEQFFALGGATTSKTNSQFNMATLAINLSAFTNGVSGLHAEVSQEMWHHLWPEVDPYESPIYPVKNGVHAPSWIAGEIRLIVDRYLGPKWMETPREERIWRRIKDISIEELWRVRNRLRERLVAYARRRLQHQLIHRGEPQTTVEQARDVLDMETLTIGFARRFATYKRGNLLFKDKERLKKILTNPKMPVQLIFAGKAHPQDDPGKQVIREIAHFAREKDMRSKIVFLEDYDIYVARHLIQGCDVWLNTPRVPYEASGTSGMKAAMNGVLHCSTADGWWADVYNPEIGWAIGAGETYDDLDYQDLVESEALYDLLEQEMVPLFYRRDKNRVARAWTEMVLRMMEIVCPMYMTTRMVDEYTTMAYVPSFNRAKRLGKKDYQQVKDLVGWQDKVRGAWKDVKILHVEQERDVELFVGSQLNISAVVQLGDLKPEDVQTEIYVGTTYGDRRLAEGKGYPLKFEEMNENGHAVFKGGVKCEQSGNHGYSVRVLPNHADLNHPLDLGLIEWE